MGLIKPESLPYDSLEWTQKPLHERGRLVCEVWAMRGYGAPLAIYGVYAAKLAFYIWAWTFFCGFSPSLGRLDSIRTWWLHPLAFEKAILWSALFEGLGFGCGSGPLTGRYLPPLGGFLYFLRPGTTKLPLFPKLPLLGGIRRTLFDNALYLALIIFLVRALIAPEIRAEQLWPVVLLIPIIGVTDRTIFLALRSEHYWTTAVVFLFASNWIAGAKAVQLALWFFAGFSKLNHHFPTVVAVMISNSPFTRFEWMRRLAYRAHPHDLRPSKLVTLMGHGGIFLELGVPIILMLAPGGWSLTLGLIMMLMLHGYITSTVPMGVPIEWNFLVVYGGFALFWAHPEITILQIAPWPLTAFLITMLFIIPILGNLYPQAISFLLAMRYYAGNWAYSVWLFKGESYKKLEKLTTSAPWVYQQLGLLYDRKTAVGIVGMVMGFRLMHLHGRALPLLLPKAVENLHEYEYLDGEIIAGQVLGWNFGDGHLHNEQLMHAIQAQCGFEPGELRCIFVESQPLFQSTMAYRIADAASGPIEAGTVEIAELRSRQPWVAGA
jgi:hypothetical protein